jgi:hypothetical protein
VFVPRVLVKPNHLEKANSAVTGLLAPHVRPVLGGHALQNIDAAQMKTMRPAAYPPPGASVGNRLWLLLQQPYRRFRPKADFRWVGFPQAEPAAGRDVRT